MKQDGRRAEMYSGLRGEEGGRGIEEARSRHHRVGLRLAGRERGAERHVGGALFVAGMHGADAIGRLVQRIE